MSDPNDFPWAPIHGMVQIRMAVFDRERGWLTSRAGITHKQNTQLDNPAVEESVLIEAKVMLRTIQHRWNKPGE